MFKLFYKNIKATLDNFNNQNSSGIIFLMYHSIVNNKSDYQYVVEKSMFEEQVNYLCDNFRVVSTEEAIALLGKKTVDDDNRKYVVLTFDDGYKNFLDNAFSIIRRKNVPVTLFVTNNYIKTGYESFLSWYDLRRLVNDGLITIGAHSYNHIYLRSLSSFDQAEEIIKSKKDLESRLEASIDFFSYPGGGYTYSALETVKKYYKAGFADRICVPGTLDRYKIPRISIDKKCNTMDDFIDLINNNFIKL